MVNNWWGGTIEDNSFGTHEFLNLCEILGTEPYISGNVGSGSVSEMAQWVEYMTSDVDSPMANLRRQNGREKPWKVKFFGVGNESWGCGGNMTRDILTYIGVTLLIAAISMVINYLKLQAVRAIMIIIGRKF